MQPIRIALVEDNEGDVVLTTELLEEAKFTNELFIFRDGVELLAYFAKCSDEENLPNLILLDINLPSMNGIDVLYALKKNERTNKIPVFILSTSNVAIDVDKAFEHNADAFLTKPLCLDAFIKAIVNHTEFYFQLITI